MPITTGNFPFGLRLDGDPVYGTAVQTTGNVFFVDSGAANGSDTPAHGKSPQRPFVTLDYAVGRCTANNGDVIFVMPGHSETHTAAAGVDLDVAGIRVVGLGEAENRPTFTFTTATTADWDVDAANITVDNVRFVCGIDSQTAMVDVNSDAFTLRNSDFFESSATGLTCIDINGGAANACDRVKIQGCRFYCTTAANWDRAIELGEVADGVEITDNYIIGDFDDAGIHNVTGKVLTNLLIARNYVRNNQSGQHAIELVSACTGNAFDNRLVTNARLTAFDAGALACQGNLWNTTTGGDTEGVPVNVTVGDVHPLLGYRVTRATADTITGAAVPIFTIAGGRVLLTALTGKVTTVIGGGANNAKFQFNPTTGTTNDICANLDIDADEAGTLYSVDGTPATAMLRSESGAVRNMQNMGLVLDIGDIEFITAANATGSISYIAYYWPIEDGATLVAA